LANASSVTAALAGLVFLVSGKTLSSNRIDSSILPARFGNTPVK
jgi:hypothetical protein